MSTRAETVMGWMMGLMIFVMVIVLIISIAQKLMTPAEELAAAEADRVARMEAEWEAERLERGIKTVEELVFIQHRESGLCFAVRDVYQHGFLAHVECELIPENLLIVQETEETEVEEQNGDNVGTE